MTTMPNKKTGTLIEPGQISNVSDTFELPFGGEITVVAFGMYEGDYCHFEVVNVPGLPPAGCECAPPIDLSKALSVQDRVLLQYKGKPVVLTPDNPIAVLTQPQGFRLRCVRHLKDEASRYNFAVRYSVSKTSCIDDSMNGLMDKDVDMNYGSSVGGEDYV